MAAINAFPGLAPIPNNIPVIQKRRHFLEYIGIYQHKSSCQLCVCLFFLLVITHSDLHFFWICITLLYFFLYTAHIIYSLFSNIIIFYLTIMKMCRTSESNSEICIHLDHCHGYMPVETFNLKTEALRRVYRQHTNLRRIRTWTRYSISFLMESLSVWRHYFKVSKSHCQFDSDIVQPWLIISFRTLIFSLRFALTR